MVPALKKTDKSGGAPIRSWHPDFRQAQRLPDVKVVRTAFFINVASIFLAIGLAAWFAIQEYSIKTLTNQLQDLNHRIESSKKASDQAVALNKTFQEQARKITEVDAFLTHGVNTSDLVLHFGDTLPKDTILDSIDVQPWGVTIKGAISGSADEASGNASIYLEMLRKDPWLSALFETPITNSLTRDVQNNRLTFDIAMKNKGGAKP